MKNNIILIGMMGAGKSTIAMELAKTLPKYKLVDIDFEIEDHQKIKISEIFEKHGEKYFRDLETKILKKICEKDFQIIATGGGIFEKKENREILKNNGKVFYLKASPEKLFDRIKTQTHRPLLKTGFNEKNIKEILENRETNYQKAHVIIDTENEFPYNIVKRIAQEGQLNEQ